MPKQQNKKSETSAKVDKQTRCVSSPPVVKTMEDLKKEEIIVAQFQKDFSFEERYNDSLECKKKHADCVPVIIERAKEFKNIKQIDDCKFLFAGQSQTAQAMVRTQKDVQAKKMWFFVHMPNNKLKMIYPQSKLELLYSRYKRSDGNLYIFYSDINLISQTSTFMIVIQTFCFILMLFYGYLYFFGAEDFIQFFTSNTHNITTDDVSLYNNQNVNPSIPSEDNKFEL